MSAQDADQAHGSPLLSLDDNVRKIIFFTQQIVDSLTTPS